MKRVTDNPLVIEQVRLAIEAIGFHNITRKLVHNHLRLSSAMTLETVPCLLSIETILKKHFHLKYKSVNPSMVKYIDPTYNERRLWVSRILA